METEDPKKPEKPKQKEFDLSESNRRKTEGMRAAEEANMTPLGRARAIAKELAREHPLEECHMDKVGQELKRRGYPSSLGPAAGSLFKTRDWEWTGKRVPSIRTTNHARELKVWRLTGE